MSAQNNGGPAFPRPSWNGAIGGHQDGMTLRDYFAAKAMHALYTSIYEYEFTGSPREPEFQARMRELAVDAYNMADAMIEARK